MLGESWKRRALGISHDLAPLVADRLTIWAYETNFKAKSLTERLPVGCELGGVYSAQELQELVTDLGRGFVL
jgi:hypothetical protein